jgi:hypothetical protein
MTQKTENPQDLPGSATPEVACPDEKATNREHLEQSDSKEFSSSQEGEPDQSTPESYYRNFEPIAALNLPHWRHTEKQLVKRLDYTLMPTLWLLYLVITPLL